MLSNIETLAIGDELLTGKISDTNSAFVGARLFSSALRLSRQSVVPDVDAVIIDSLKEAARRADFIVCFGGLGPTSDDRTVDCVANLLNCEAVVHGPSETKMRAWYGSRKRPVSTESLRQVRFPNQTKALLNQTGMAPGFSFKIGECFISCLPGVPSEMKPMFDEYVLPEILRELGHSTEMLSKTWRCIGIPESDLQTRMNSLEKDLQLGVWTGYRTLYPENHFTVYAEANREAAFLGISAQVDEILSDVCYSTQVSSLEEALAELLRQRNWSIGFAESCTGGLCAQRMTRLSGASDYVYGGFVVYQYPSKALVGVELDSAEQAVSQKTSTLLAQGVLEKTPVDVAVGVTGYLGPGGGTKESPEGTTYLTAMIRGDSSKHQTINVAVRPDRYLRQWACSSYALSLVLDLVKNSKA